MLNILRIIVVFVMVIKMLAALMGYKNKDAKICF